MTQIQLYNTRTRRKEPFAPIDPANVRMYVCGPTVYDRAHLGNARPVVVFDVLFRLLRHVYGDRAVTYVRNFTDVDDKINARARAMQEGGDTRALNTIIRSLTDETIAWYHADMDALGALRPTVEPRATEYIAQMIGMIAGLVARGHAYAAEGHVLFDVRSYPEYGRLSGRSVDDMIAGARVEVAPYKRDPMDFVLWKPSGDDEPGWESPWGRGRPGWHIECSAMARELLGESFDIHGGGIDLQFPHHENEIAQSCCAHPEGEFARFWLHNEMVQVDGKKMSKSLGNFFTVRDLLNQGWPGEVIRFVMLSTHYRKPMDWTEEKAREAKETLTRWHRYKSDIFDDVVQAPANEIVDSLMNDLNTSQAISKLHKLHAKVQDAYNQIVALGAAYEGPDPASLEMTFVASARFLGFLNEDVSNWSGRETIKPATVARIERLLERRRIARAEKDWARSDLIRGFLNIAGVVVEDGENQAWKLGFDHEPFGWLAVSRAAIDGKSVIPFSEVEALALSRGVKYELDGRNYWKNAGTRGEPDQLQESVLKLAEREAFT